MKKLLFLLMCSVALSYANAQVTILSSAITSYNVTPETMLYLTVLNSGTTGHAKAVSTLQTANGQIVLKVTSSEFILTGGTNALVGNVPIQSIEFSNTELANYVKTTHRLPSGNYKYCCSVVVTYGNEPQNTDEYCDNIESDQSDFLTLISPYDGEELNTPYPILIWNHNEPFSVLQPGEYFRIVVTELLPEQTPEAAINVNLPVFFENNLQQHNIQYPLDAVALEKGKKYAWQVLKYANGVVVNKTEAWQFVYPDEKNVPDNKYAMLTKEASATFYTANNNKVFFRFDEQYKDGPLTCSIYDERRNELKPQTATDNEKSLTTEINIKQNGYNAYMIDLNNMKLKPGYYYLEVTGTKADKYLLKFKVN